MNFSTQTKKAGFIQPQPRCPFRYWIGRLFCCLCLFFLTVKLFYTMKLIYFEKSFISVFGFIIPSFFSFARSKERRKLPTLKLFFYAGKPKRLVIQGFLQKEKERKLLYQWYHNFRSYLVRVARLELTASWPPVKRATSCATPGCT